MNDKDNEIRQHVWDYFQLHASQRLKTFEFYIVIATVLLSGYFVSLKENNLMPIGIVVGILLIVLSFIFWKLDARNKQLIKNAEEALKIIEKSYVSESNLKDSQHFQLFANDDLTIKQIKNKTNSLSWNRHFSYSNCFNVMFLVFAILGALAIVWTCYCLMKHNGRTPTHKVKTECVIEKDFDEAEEYECKVIRSK